MDALDRWRFRCPHGHTAWEMNRRTFWCSECFKRIDGHSGQLDRIRDLKTDEWLTADELRLRIASP